MKRIVLGVQYDGTPWQGWQTQPGGNTVQDRLELALQKFTLGKVATICAGRTDAGVHALEQVVHVYIGREALGVSAGLKMEIAASMCARSARACSRSRSYLAMFPAISSRLERNVVTVRISAMKQTGR